MDVVIRELMVGDEDRRKSIDDSFTVDAALVLTLTGRQIGYKVEKIPAYTKSYSDEPYQEAADNDFSEYIHSPDRIAYLAFAEDQAIGRIVLRRNWNKYAYVEDIAIDKKFRGRGVGRQLIDQAKRWARDGGMPGIMLETQSNNVGACKFYDSCGFVIGGFDLRLYQGIHKQSDEIAIFWYMIFE